MNTPTDFPTRLAELKAAMQREEWVAALERAENLGTVPDKFLPVVANIVFYLLISRNRHDKLLALADKFEIDKSKHGVAALLLFRDKALGYKIALPETWSLDEWENALEGHALAGRLEPKELPLCLHFLSILGRPRLLDTLLRQAVETGPSLDNELVEIVVRCYLRCGWFKEARRIVWRQNVNDIAFERFEFLIDRAEHRTTAVPESSDKFLSFIRLKFGDHVPACFP